LRGITSQSRYKVHPLDWGVVLYYSDASTWDERPHVGR
jgi:hypothetical protein